MRHATAIALVSACFVVFPLQGWCAEPSPIEIPKRGDPGWTFSGPPDQSVQAPRGYEGRTDTSSMIATGREDNPETRGKHIVAHFEFGNLIKTCPQADGTVEGEGVFSLSVKITNAHANGTSTTLIETRATARYKGQVSEDGYLDEPVIAEIDYTYTQTGSTREAGGGLTTPAVPSVHQSMTRPFMVPHGEMAPPEFAGFSGGNPIAGHYAEALGVGTALAYWGGVFYSVAQIRWRQGECAHVVFDPSTATVALSGQTTVNVQVKSEDGGIAKANSTVSQRSDGSSVSPGGGFSDVGSPLKLTYKAPDNKNPNAGFSIKATSRAGVAQGDWKAGLGSGWSGQISCTRDFSEGGVSELLSWDGHDVMTVKYDVKDGVATATGHGEGNSMATRRQKALRGGAVTVITTGTESSQGKVDGTSPATVNISVDKAKGTYSIGVSVDSTIAGISHTSICGKDGKCQQSDSPVYVDSCVEKEIRGTLSEPNQLRGTMSDSKPAGHYGNGKQTVTVTWDLTRQGSSE